MKHDSLEYVTATQEYNYRGQRKVDPVGSIESFRQFMKID